MAPAPGTTDDRRARRVWRPTREQALASLGLAIALVFVVLVTYLPHMETQADETDADPWTHLATTYAGFASGTRDDYEYPIHVDEPMHWARMAEMQRSDSLRHPDPYTGSVATDSSLSLRGLVHEKGFYVAFAGFQEMTGIGWFDLIRLVPALWAGLTASLVFFALRPWKGAPLAAALVAFIPTTPRFLGPAFFVPIGIGLAWVALALLLLGPATRDRRTLLMLLLVSVWAFFIHLIAGFAVLLAILVAVPLHAPAGRRNALLLALATLLPLVWLYEGFRPSVEEEFARVGFLPTDFTAFDLLGIPFLVAWVLGVTWVAQRTPTDRTRTPLVTATVAGIVAFLLIVGDQALGIDRYAFYDRWHQPFALFATIPVAYALVGAYDVIRDGIVRATAPAPHKAHKIDPRSTRRIGRVAVLSGLLVATLATGAVATPSLDQHLDEPYYRVLDASDFRTFQAAKDTPEAYDTFLTHPWKAPVFTAMTGRQPYTWLQPGHPPIHGEDYVEYVRTGHTDPTWLVERGITMVLATDVPPDTEAYTRDASGAWLLDPAHAETLYRIRHGRAP